MIEDKDYIYVIEQGYKRHLPRTETVTWCGLTVFKDGLMVSDTYTLFNEHPFWSFPRCRRCEKAFEKEGVEA